MPGLDLGVNFSVRYWIAGTAANVPLRQHGGENLPRLQHYVYFLSPCPLPAGEGWVRTVIGLHDVDGCSIEEPSKFVLVKTK